MNTKPPLLEILKMSYSVMCQIQKKKKKWTQNEETIPLKESLEMFYSKSCTNKKM